MVGIGAPTSGASDLITAPPAVISFVDWGAVLAGGAMAAALSFVLLTFGTTIGLSVTSPWPDAGLSTKSVASIAAFWTLLQQIAAFIVGGYVAGRMRPRWTATDAEEVEFRDGLHGGLVWALGVVITAFLALSTVGSVLKSGTELAGRAASVAATNIDPVAYQIDTMLRPGQVAPPRQAAAQGPAAGARQIAAVTSETRAELGRIFARSIANGSLADNDRTYLVGIVAQRTGVPQDEAERRVNTAIAETNRATKEAADRARKAAVLSGFIASASVVISLGAAWWAAVQGGRHRDNSIPARFPINYRRPTV